MEVHPFATRGYAHVAEAYERGRPGYPAAAIAWLAERLALAPGATVVDVGAGTGKLTRQLAALGTRVVAVEPIASMRAVLTRVVPEAEARAGSAEAIPLPDASADALTVGQAAHWFRPEEAAAEFARVLRPGGGFGVIWNTPDLADPLQAAFAGLVAPARARAPEGRPEGRAGWREGLEHGPFTPLEHASFRHVHELAAEDVPALVGSLSYVGGLPADERGAMLDRARELVQGSEDPAPGPGARVRLAYRTEALACRRL